MKIEMQITYNSEDVIAILKEDYLKRFGPVKEDYELIGSERYSNYVIEVRLKEIVDEPKKDDLPF